MMMDSMDSNGISFRQVPHTTTLFADYLYDFPRLASFYAHDPNAPVSFRSAAEAIQLDSERRVALADILTEQNRTFGGDASVEDNIARLRQPGTVAVVTGQQVGLFGGPAYSVYKALTAVRLAAKLTAEGVPAVPVFWMATYDHDFAEVSHTTVLDDGHQFLTLRDDASPSKDAPVGTVVFGNSVQKLRKQLLALWPREQRAEGEKLLAGYQAGKTYGEAFGHLFQQLFAGHGLVVLDPCDARVQALAKPLYARMLEERDELITALQQRNLEIGRAGYHAQVEVRDETTLLFVTVKGRRRALHRRSNGFHLPGRGECSVGRILKELDETPERFSPSALLRPVVQDWLLPTVAYVGGPAEVSYFAQSAVLYERLLGRMPVVAPRASLTLVEPRVGRVLRQYGLEVCDTLVPSARLHARVAERRLPRRLQTRLERTEGKVEKMLEETARAVAELDLTLENAVETSRRKMLYQFSKIRGKVARAQAERTGVVHRHVNMLWNSLYPQRVLQERRLNFLNFAARHGTSLVSCLLEEEKLLCRDHLVIHL